MFFRERKDTSQETIANSADFLNKKPRRQGSNQQDLKVSIPEPKNTSYPLNKK